MLDTQTAINYLKQVVDQFVEERLAIARDTTELERKKKQLLLDREALTASKSSFYAQTGEMTRKIEEAEKMRDLATKMKLQVDEERAELAVMRKGIDVDKLALKKREEKLVAAEVLQKELDDRSDKLAELELSLIKREDKVEKDKQAARVKSEDLALQLAGVEKTRERLQHMIDIQKV